MNMTRRTALKLAALAPAVQFGIPRALASETIVAVTWGGPWFEFIQKIGAEWSAKTGNQILWQQHDNGASATVVAKVMAAWPNPKQDVINSNDPAIYAMAAEGWLEPLDDLPSMKDMPEEFIIKDAEGRAVSAPHDAEIFFWGYRSDLVPKGVKSLSDILKPDFPGGIGLRDVSLYSGVPLVSLALERGGSETNIDPAFDFLKDIAKTGKVAGVFGSAVDAVNSMVSGESAITLATGAEWKQIGEAAPIQLLNRVPNGKGLKAFYSLAQWCVPKTPRKELAKAFVEYLISPEPCERYASETDTAPTNKKSKASGDPRFILTGDELKDFGYFCNYKLMSEKSNSWTERYNTEIRPLMRA